MLFNKFIIILFPCFAFAQSLQLNLANDLYSEGYFYNSITEYERCAFFSNDSSIVNLCFRKISYAYVELGNDSLSINYLKRALKYTNSDSLFVCTKLDLATIYISLSNYDMATIVLYRLLYDKRAVDFHKDIYVLISINYLLNNDFDKAILNIKTIFTDFDQSQLQDFKKKHTRYLSNLKRVKLLSTILPGSGQIFQGEFVDGLNAFSINSILAYITIKSIVSNNIFDGIFYFTTLFLRYYKGNIDNTISIATNNYQHQINNLKKSILLLIMSVD